MKRFLPLLFVLVAFVGCGDGSTPPPDATPVPTPEPTMEPVPTPQPTIDPCITTPDASGCPRILKPKHSVVKH